MFLVFVVVVYKKYIFINSVNFDRIVFYYREFIIMFFFVYCYCERFYFLNVFVNGGYIFFLICNKRRIMNILINLCFYYLFFFVLLCVSVVVLKVGFCNK